MKKPLIVIFIILASLLFAFAILYLHPLYKSATEVARIKSGMNIVSATESHAKIKIKPSLFIGEGAIIPFDLPVKVGPTPLDVDLSDRSLVRFTPESTFRIVRNEDAKYTIYLHSGEMYFKRSKIGNFKAIRAPRQAVFLKGTEGYASESETKLIAGIALLNGTLELKALEAWSNQVKKALTQEDIDEINKALDDLNESDQKDVIANMFEYIPKIADEINQNTLAVLKEEESKPTTKEIPPPSQEETSKDTTTDNILYRYLLKKVKVYRDMYILRMAISYDRVFDSGLQFPSSIEQINDPIASQITHDPWQTHYLYTTEGNSYFNLRSAGRDRTMYTRDDIILFRTEGGQFPFLNL